MNATHRERWTWRFSAPRQRVWEILADTARFNEASGFPKHHIEESVNADGSVRYMAHAKVGPIRISWEDIPQQWVAGRFYLHRREFAKGPFGDLTVAMHLSSEGEETRADYDFAVTPRGPLGRLAVPVFARASRRVFGRMVADARAFLAGQTEDPYRIEPAPVPSRVRARAARIVAAIESTPYGHGLAERLADFALTGPENDVQHLRPRRLARRWDVPERQATEACLKAARSGLLRMEWVLLCPRCRGAKASSPSLDQLPEGVHCGTCNIDYERDFQRNVELTFQPAKALRDVEFGEFCLFGPMSTPHVLLQRTVSPGQDCSETLALPEGAYRVRTLHPGPQRDVRLGAGEAIATVAVADGALDVATGPAGGAVRFRNVSDRRATVVIESRAWVDDALTALNATTLQGFRDLFPEEALRSGDELSIERVALLFTDLKGSTALYERVGDAKAYDLVRAHFAYLTKHVRAHDGAIVKTIGDAVMAAFADPADAAAAAIAVQRGASAFNREHELEGEGIVVRLGVHLGPVIAVQLNRRLDYFGATVNMAARLQGKSLGGDIVLSSTVAVEPDVASLIESYGPEEDSGQIRGVDGTVRFIRIPRDTLADRAAVDSCPEIDEG